MLQVRPHNDDGLTGKSQKEHEPQNTIRQKPYGQEKKDQERPHEHGNDQIIAAAVEPNGIHYKPQDQRGTDRAGKYEPM